MNQASRIIYSDVKVITSTGDKLFTLKARYLFVHFSLNDLVRLVFSTYKKAPQRGAKVPSLVVVVICQYQRIYLTEVPIDITLGTIVLRCIEDILGLVMLNEFPHQEKSSSI